MDADTPLAIQRAATDDRPPQVSVVMPAYNAAPYLVQAIDSILGQTFTDFEFIIVDDGSTDDTRAIVQSYADPRIRLVVNAENSGVVRSRTRGVQEARGTYIAHFDADDVSLPTKLAKQVTYLDANPGVMMTGTATRYLEGSTILPGKTIEATTPAFLRWVLHVSNPIGHATVMYRATAMRALQVPMLQEFIFAEDFEYWHRMLSLGDVGFINEPLLLYRRHAGAVSAKNQLGMQNNTAKVLERVYTPWLGDSAGAAARLVASGPFQRRAPPDLAALHELGVVLGRLLDGFFATYPVSGSERMAILAHAGKLWLAARRAAVRAGLTQAVVQPVPAFAGAQRGLMPDDVVSALSGRTPFKAKILALKQSLTRDMGGLPPARTEFLGQVRYETAPVDRDRPATLFVVVDCEAEFDWSKPFDRLQTGVTAIQSVGRGQAVFDRYGLRPVYVTDYAIVSQPEGYLPLRAIHDRGGCALGAHLHPWINPPFEEALSVHNSYAGNLPLELEREKLQILIAAFVRAFGFRPRYFKAGRYGVGPHTMDLLAAEGIRVDFSVIPGRDLSPMGGPDFRPFDSAARLAADDQVLCLPMTRERIGLLGRSAAAARLVEGPGRQLALPGLFSRLGLLDLVTLTPEGETAARQIALIRAMLARGQRQFVMHYHSPSLAPGFTPYGNTAEAADEIVRRLETVCDYFFERVGGVPGNPNDLLPVAEREVPRPAVLA